MMQLLLQLNMMIARGESEMQLFTEMDGQAQSSEQQGPSQATNQSDQASVLEHQIGVLVVYDAA